MKKKVKVKKRLKMSKFERLLYTLALFLLVMSPISIVFSKATLAKVNFEVEKQKKEIEAQKKTNESIAMTIDELASLTKIQEVASPTREYPYVSHMHSSHFLIPQRNGTFFQSDIYPCGYISPCILNLFSLPSC